MEVLQRHGAAVEEGAAGEPAGAVELPRSDLRPNPNTTCQDCQSGLQFRPGVLEKGGQWGGICGRLGGTSMGWAAMTLVGEAVM